MVLLLQYTLIFASVLILVALGGCFAEHSGVINLGLEGIMIMGALGGALAMRYISPNVPAIVMILGVLAISALVGMIYSCLLAVACINFKADQTLVGTALNLLGTAGATVIVKAINTAANPDDVSSIVQYAGAKKAFTVNLGSFEFSWFMLVTALLLAASYVLLYKTRFGLRLMACGEHPQAADSVGINVYKMRWAGVLISGLLGGLGVTAIAGFSCASKISSLLMMPVYGFIQSIVFFIAQNTAAAQPDRVQTGLREGRRILFVYSLLVVTICILFREPLLRLFTTDTETARCGAVLLAFESVSYLFVTQKHLLEGRLRGAQKMGLYLLSNLGQIGLNLLCCILLVPLVGFNGFWLSTWISTPAGLVLAYVLVKASRT